MTIKQGRRALLCMQRCTARKSRQILSGSSSGAASFTVLVTATVTSIMLKARAFGVPLSRNWYHYIFNQPSVLVTVILQTPR
jgi:hypothetical protein